LSPDPGDNYYRRKPEKYSQELLTRLATPLNGLVFAILPLVFLSQAETTRQSRSSTIAMAAGSAVVIASLSFSLSISAGENLLAAIALFALPTLAFAISVFLVLRGIQPRPPEKVLILADRIGRRAKRLLRIPTPQGA
jgi:lipopolysaccharide export system permease protein